MEPLSPVKGGLIEVKNNRNGWSTREAIGKTVLFYGDPELCVNIQGPSMVGIGPFLMTANKLYSKVNSFVKNL